MSFAKEMYEIVTDHTTDSFMYARMVDTLRSEVKKNPGAMTALREQLAEDFLPIDPNPEGTKDELAAIFTMGVMCGREHARRGYPEPTFNDEDDE